MSRSLTLLFALSFVLLAGCRTNQPQPQLVAEPDQVTLRLAQAADRAANALDTLASVEQVRTPTELPPLTADAPPELRRSITFDWYGPVEPLVKTLADRASYRVVVTGNAPESVIIVTLKARNETVIEALRDVGLQMGTRAQINVDANQKTIELADEVVQIETPK